MRVRSVSLVAITVLIATSARPLSARFPDAAEHAARVTTTNSPEVERLPAVAEDQSHGIQLVQFEESFDSPPMDSLGSAPIYGPSQPIYPLPDVQTGELLGASPGPEIQTSDITAAMIGPTMNSVGSQPPINPTEITAPPTSCRTCSDGSCYGGLCGCRDCGSRFWIRAEVLGWWLRGFRTPPLATLSPAGTANVDAGVLGRPSTSIIFGDERVGDGYKLGGRLRGGWWLDGCRSWGVEGDFFALGHNGESFLRADDGDPILARPFFNTDPAVNAQDAQIIAFAGLAAGSLSIEANNQVYSGAALLRGQLSCFAECDCCSEGPISRLDLLAGYRYFHLGEDLNALETLLPQGALFVPGTTIELRDTIATNNDFNGGEFGLHYQRQSGFWVFELLPRIALGHIRQQVILDGSTRAVIPAVSDQTVAGGFLVPADRIGTFSNEDFAVIPQAEITIGYLVNPSVRVHVGYNFLYINNVVRPGDLIDLNIDGRNIGVAPPPGLATTASAFTRDRVYLHGFTIGFTWNF